MRTLFSYRRSLPKRTFVPDLAHQWRYLKDIEADLPQQLPNATIGLLIGPNFPKALEPIDLLAIASKDGGPFAIETFAGWAIVGPLCMCIEEHPAVDSLRVAGVEVCSGRHLDHHFMVEDKVREIITPQAVNKMFQLDFSEQTDGKELGYSQEDKLFFNIVTQGILHTEYGHYETPLPVCRDNVCFPENKEQVLQRAHWLRRKLINNQTFYKDYVNFKNSIIAEG